MFHLEASNGYISCKVYPQSKLPKGVPKQDIIRLKAKNERGNFIDCFVYPQEAVLLATALLRAYAYTVHINKDNLKPRKTR